MKDDAQVLGRSGKIGAAAGIAAAALLWLASYYGLPAPQGSGDSSSRLAFAGGWIAVALLFGLGMAVEAVAHERLQTDAFDPLSGNATRRLQINQRYLQNSLEQSVLFAGGLVALALLGNGEASMRAITACAIVWIVTRYLFWLGYHRSSELRVIGIAGLAQSLVVLIWVTARFGYQHWGPAGATAPIIALLVIEAVLVTNTRRKPVK